MAVLGPRAMRASAMNAGVGGITLPLPLVMSAPDRGHVLRSVLEATAYAVRANLEQLEEVGGARDRDARDRRRHVAQRGCSRRSSPTSSTGRSSVARAPETSALGAAALAAVAVGLHAYARTPRSRDDAGGARSSSRTLRASAAYEDCYARWCAMADAFERMGGA